MHRFLMEVGFLECENQKSYLVTCFSINFSTTVFIAVPVHSQQKVVNTVFKNNWHPTFRMNDNMGEFKALHC